MPDMKPILFNTDMVCAILDGRKTVTRRVVKAPVLHRARNPDSVSCKDGWATFNWRGPIDTVGGFNIKSPYQPGDILYVREKWRNQPLTWSREDGYSDFELQYRADFTDAENDCYGRRGGVAPMKWHPSIHMPKEAARLFLRVTGVRVERLQDIDDAGAEKEGLRYWDDICRDETWHPTFYDPDSGGSPSVIDGFSKLWDSTIKPADREKYGWAANPWVWVIEFERISKEEASDAP